MSPFSQVEMSPFRARGRAIFGTKGEPGVGEILPMSQRELSRLEVIQRVCRKALTQRRAADLLSLSVRQVKRLLSAYRRGGAAALVSKRRGRPSNNRLRP